MAPMARVSDLHISQLQETGCMDARGYTLDALLDALLVLGINRRDASIDLNGDLVVRS
jgi:hypothetical protein